MPLGPLPSLGPFGRVVDVRVYPHGFTTQQTTDAGPAGSAIVRPNIESAAWHAAGTQKYGGNILWTGSTPRHTIAYNGPRGRWFGPIFAGGVYCYSAWLAYNGAKIDAPAGTYVLGAAIHEYDGLADVTYTGAGDSALTMDTPPAAATAVTGIYTLRCTVGGGVGAQFVLRRPDDTPIAALVLPDTPLVFDGELRFILAVGAVPHVVGDEWQIEVEEPTQIVAVVTGAPDSNSTETLYRRGVSLLGTWKAAGSIPIASGQVDGSLQPWFFNAAGTQAVTCRGLGAGPDGLTAGVVARTLTVTTVSVADTIEVAAARVSSAVNSISSADETGPLVVTDEASSTSTGPVAQLMALDFDGASLVRVEIEYDGYFDGASTMSGTFDSDQHDVSLSATYSATAALLVGGTAVLQLVSVSAAASLERHWTPTEEWVSSVSEGITAATAHDVADPRAARTAYTAWQGSQVATGTSHVDGTLAASGVAMRQYVAGSVVAEALGGVGSVSAVPTDASLFANLIWNPGSEAEDSSITSPVVLDVRQIICAGVGALGPTWTVRVPMIITPPYDSFTVAAAALPAVASGGAAHHTSATDARGNWLMAAAVAAPALDFCPGSFPASGTYTDAAGGPDSLTPATVATLTAHPGDDRWGVGVF